MYLPNPAVGPTGGEPAEFIESAPLSDTRDEPSPSPADRGARVTEMSGHDLHDEKKG